MMTCKDFVGRLDLYLDHRLAQNEQSSVSTHLRNCHSCRSLAGAHQERQVVLRTAVTDVVAAVDLSGLWGSVRRAIDNEPPAKETLGWRSVWNAARRRVVRWGAARPFAFTPIQGAAWAVAAAVVLIVVFSLGGPDVSRVQVAEQVTPPSSRRSHSHAANVRIDSLEASAGYTVATWTQSRTGAQVIWVAGGDDAGSINLIR